MQSRWSEQDTASLSGLDLLVYASRLIGAETSLVVWGGGNTSIKVAERDHRGRPVEVLRVKGSGSDLKSIRSQDFPGVRMNDIQALLDRDDMGDEEMVAYLAHALQEVGGPRPSIETLLHGFLPAAAVIHTHADAIVSLTNTSRAREVISSVYGESVIPLAYRRPGFKISKDVADTIAASPGARAILLEKHGTITWGRTIRDAYDATIALVSAAEEAIAARCRGRRVFGAVSVRGLPKEERQRVAQAVLPRLRGMVGRAILTFEDTERVVEFVSSRAAGRLSQIGPATPDHTIYTKRLPCYVPVDRADDPDRVAAAMASAVDQFAADYARYVAEHAPPGLSLADPKPRVVLVPGLGMFAAGKDKRTAGIITEIYGHTIDVLGQASAFGEYVSLSARDAFDVEYWPLELYKLSLAPSDRELARRIALVTGAASGIGRAAAARLAREGAHVVVADLDAAGARKVAEDIALAQGAGRAIGVSLDVTDEGSVAEAFAAAVLAYGGLDIVVSNAGIAHSAPVEQLERSEWERSFAVNATGHFLVARAAMRLFRTQGLGGSLVFVATKNVMSPGKDFAAYSASKAAEAQLAKVLALEGGSLGVRSNIVNPDAVFRDSRLWSDDVRRERAAAQGIAVDDLEDFYRRRNLLGAPIFPEDVAEAILFFASDRSSKTTGCTLTVDGGIKDAFPR